MSLRHCHLKVFNECPLLLHVHQLFVTMNLWCSLQYYLRSGGCKYGKSCKNLHDPRAKVAPALVPAFDYNFLGLPLRVVFFSLFICISTAESRPVFIKLSKSEVYILFDVFFFLTNYHRGKKNACSICEQDRASMECTAGLVILIPPMKRDQKTRLVIITPMFHYKVDHNPL